VRIRQYLDACPGLAPIYDFKQRLARLLTTKHRTAKQCRRLIPEFLEIINQLQESPLNALKTLGETLFSWRLEIARMWRFTKTNSITEGFHNKMEMISRRAYGFRNFENYRLRVKAHCG
jgi:transposase